MSRFLFCVCVCLYFTIGCGHSELSVQPIPSSQEKSAAGFRSGFDAGISDAGGGKDAGEQSESVTQDEFKEGSELAPDIDEKRCFPGMRYKTCKSEKDCGEKERCVKPKPEECVSSYCWCHASTMRWNCRMDCLHGIGVCQGKGF